MLLEMKTELTLDSYYHYDLKLQSTLENKIEYLLLKLDAIHYGKKVDIPEDNELYEFLVIKDSIVSWYKDKVNRVREYYSTRNIPEDSMIAHKDLLVLYEGITQAYVSVKVTYNIDVRIVNDIPLNYLGEEEWTTL